MRQREGERDRERRKERGKGINSPVHVFEGTLLSTRMSTQQDDNRIGLSRNETEVEDILVATVVAFKDCFSQRTVLVKSYFFTL